MDETVLNAALAGLLHDVGKFSLRAGNRGSRNWDGQAKVDFGRFHAILTYDFIDKYVPKKIAERVKHLAANHHRPGKREEYVIALADRLSAGERADPDDDTRAAQPRQLLSIFCVVRADGQENTRRYYWPLRPLALDDTTRREEAFPAPEWPEAKTWKTYQDMWEDFCRYAQSLTEVHEPEPDAETYLESLLLLCQRFLWCMPSAYYRARPDISLYDHSRLTGALAAILVQSGFSDDSLKAMAEAPEARTDEAAMLVGADLSGVQDFIYTITHRGATSALRGRSFYLQLLTEVVARHILRRLQLPTTNLIYAGGGVFYLLARPADKDCLAAIQRDISRTLYAHHRGDLYLALAARPLQLRDFFEGRIGGKWRELQEDLQQAKQRRFFELTPADLQVIFQPAGHGGNEELQCQVCGREHGEITIEEPAVGRRVRKCRPCRSLEELGRQLRRPACLVFEEVEPAGSGTLDGKAQPGDWEKALADFGLRVTVSQDGQILPPENGSKRLVLALSERAFQGLVPAPRTAVGRRFLVNVTPLVADDDVRSYQPELEEYIKEGDVKPFGLLEMQAEGIARLGVLRMDVDDLGKLFSGGLGGHTTLSRVAALSSAISWYFEGWVHHLAQKRNMKNGDRLYSIYSGGDDLFFVGAWDEVVELAIDIRRDLMDYAASHPGIHGSAGIVLVSGKHPLAQAARDAGQAEERAKALRWWDAEGKARQKDAVCFLGETLPWERFGLGKCDFRGTDDAHGTAHFLAETVAHKEGNRSLIRVLARLHERYRVEARKRQRAGAGRARSGAPQALWGPWNWLFVYLLRRMEERTDDRSLQDRLTQLRHDMQADFHRRIEWLGLAARWAELKTRRRD